MRKAGQVLEGNSSTKQLARKAIEDAGEMFAPEVAPLVASEHIMLDSGHRGFINDGDPKSYIYRSGFKGESKPNQKYANPIKGKGAGAKEYRELTPQEDEQFNRLMDYLDNQRRTTGDWA